MFANEQSTQESSISSAEAKADLEKGMAVSGVENSTEAKQETQNTEKTSENSEDDKISIPETARDSKKTTESSTQENTKISYFIKEFQKAFKFKEALVLVSWLIILYGDFFIIDLELEDSFSYLRYFPKFLKLEKEISKWLNTNFNDEVSQYSMLNSLNEVFLVMLSYKESLVEPVLKNLLESSIENTRKYQLEDYLKSMMEFVD
ncbi:hypothetical protein ACIMQ0_002971 [Enterococcus faecalis]|uniref:hypothetical protein n=1 Tax=Enterococcus faecalis TaxID=1351 RepID=UPI0021DFFD8E|nr:hypothetical protein [Enterococcus faecalis]EKK5253796.1 hypothetical protein [Enterococcus faecalis]MCU9764373.1 hypothetical protein [Enterococcus faecalis]